MDGGGFERPRLRSLLEHFAEVRGPREPAEVRHPLPEVLLLVVAASIAGCDGYDEIAEWGQAHPAFLRAFSGFHFGVPGADWLRVEMNRSDPALFQACFAGWATSLRPDAADLIAIDGKTARRGHDRGRRALHPISALWIGLRRSSPSGRIASRWPAPSGWCSLKRRWRTKKTSAARSPTRSTGWRWMAPRRRSTRSPATRPSRRRSPGAAAITRWR